VTTRTARLRPGARGRAARVGAALAAVAAGLAVGWPVSRAGLMLGVLAVAIAAMNGLGKAYSP
jgi:hypothetical protein